MHMSYFNKGSFTYSFPIWMCFISLPHFIEFIRTSSTMLNRNNETKHSWFVSDNMKKAFGVSSLDMIHPFISLINFFYILCFLLMCIKNGRLILSNTFFSTPIDHMDFFFCINHLKQTQQQTKLKSHTVVHPIPEDQYKWFPVGKTWYRIQSRKISNIRLTMPKEDRISGQTVISQKII